MWRPSNYGIGDEHRIVIIGKTGAGKSASANSLLSKDVFSTKFSAVSVTQICAKAEGSYKGKKVVLVDTPGLFDTVKSQAEIKDEIMKCVAITSPGPHAIVLVVQVGRITPEEQETVKNFMHYFGEGVYDYLIVLFTKIDALEEEGQTLDEYVQNIPGALKDVLRRCKNRYIGIDNKNKKNQLSKQKDKFFETLRNIVRSNGNLHYSNEMYKAVEAAIQERLKKVEQENARLKDREKKRIEQETEEAFLAHKLEGLAFDEYIRLRAGLREDVRYGRGLNYSTVRGILSGHIR